MRRYPSWQLLALGVDPAMEDGVELQEKDEA